ncbi:MAG: DUF2970 domain-containing protein [Variovorax sp.]|nr:MAG: DUF2970 domain-containing protein [Variovorax sp.]
MSNFMRYVRAVLWAFIGLGGRQSDATSRVDKAGALPMIAIALVLVLLLVAGLIAVARFAAGA